eukprot:gb/GECG01006348.1/.p1 GENE.gb/GECG01006348.1/~~gb/GECG01006348.1/.p1  ORF type:complete len:427 (+),score=55.46 gb/GECG01006348.1/:1-1281(+)
MSCLPPRHRLQFPRNISRVFQLNSRPSRQFHRTLTHYSQSQAAMASSPPGGPTIPFSGSHNAIDRQGAGQRKELRFFSSLFDDSQDAEVLLFNNLKPLAVSSKEAGGSVHLAYLPAKQTLESLGISELLKENDPAAMDFVVLGKQVKRGHPVIAVELSSRFHADGTKISEEWVFENLKRYGISISDHASFVEGRKFLVKATTEEQQHDLAVFSMSRGFLAWHAQSRYCGHDGSRTVLLEGGTKRKSLTDIPLYPRTDPVVIMAVEHPSEDKILLGRGHKHPKGFISCLAGFVEPGETLEDAVRREVEEEAGIAVNTVQYYSSQPWPLPRGAAFGQLMIGCIGKASSCSIVESPSEIELAKWIDWKDAEQMVQRSKDSTGLPDKDEAQWSIPGPFAVAHHLIKGWVEMKRRTLPVESMHGKLFGPAK